MAFQRQTAVHCSVKDLREGAWLEGKPAGIATTRGFVGRASLIGLCVGNDEGTVMLDDGTGVIRAHKAERSLASAKTGTPTLLIGVPKEFDGERYLDLEIARPVDRKWIDYRKKELALGATAAEDKPAAAAPAQDGKSPLLRIIDLIRDLDEGGGADLDEVLARYAGSGGSEHVRTLLEEGEIFEIRPGKVKVLE